MPCGDELAATEALRRVREETAVTPGSSISFGEFAEVARLLSSAAGVTVELGKATVLPRPPSSPIMHRNETANA